MVKVYSTQGGKAIRQIAHSTDFPPSNFQKPSIAKFKNTSGQSENNFQKKTYLETLQTWKSNNFQSKKRLNTGRSQFTLRLTEGNNDHVMTPEPVKIRGKSLRDF